MRRKQEGDKEKKGEEVGEIKRKVEEGDKEDQVRDKEQREERKEGQG